MLPKARGHWQVRGNLTGVGSHHEKKGGFNEILMGYHVDIIWISLDWLSWEIWDIQFLLNLGKASNRVTYNQTWQPF